MAWICLFFAGLLEVVWAYFMKQSSGFEKIVPTVITFIAMGFSVIFLASAMRTLPLSTAYVLWTGLGALGTFLVGACLLEEPLTTSRTIAVLFILSGLILLEKS